MNHSGLIASVILNILDGSYTQVEKYRGTLLPNPHRPRYIE